MTAQDALFPGRGGHDPLKSGRWIGASKALGRDVLVGEPYVHICGFTIDGWTKPGLRVRLWKRDCAACVQEQHEHETAGRAPPDGWQEADRRRIGEREDDE